MNRKYLVWILIFVLCILAFLAAFLFQSANPYDRTFYEIEIPKGISAYAVQEMLERKGILRPDSSFVLAARLLNISKHIQAGKYRISPSQTLLEILLVFRQGRVEQPELLRVKVTFPEGTSIYKMGEILRKEGVSDPDKFQALVKEGITPTLRQKHWGLFKYLPTESLEGFLYPDTYWFFASAKVEDLAEIMVSRFEEVVLPFWEKASKDTKLNLFEVLTLASIIEKEAADPKERPVISSVFRNRLEIKMPLDSCSTIKYALERPTKIVYYDQLEVDSPYNTYKKRGLPPGPICNPGIDSIKAAVYPAKTDYLYFVSKKDGTHVFSKTFAEHQRARKKYPTPTR